MGGNSLVGYGFGEGIRRKIWTKRMERVHNGFMNHTEMREIPPCSHRPTGGASSPSEPKAMWNRVLEGDCLGIADSWPQGTLDLVYLDPPFFTNREHSGNGRAKMESPRLT